jgi:hypothetical protein
MVHLRILSVIAPRLSQLLGWTVDTNSYVDPLLKREEVPRLKHQILSNLQANLYQPPAYTPPPVPVSGKRS